MKVVTVVGTRPEVIRLARVMARLDATPGIEHVLVHTGQNWDHQLNGVFFDEMGLRAPDHVLDVSRESLGATLGDLISKIEPVLLAEQPDAFLVLGDTNSALSLIMAKRLQISTYHMEAGNRCFDENVPEETNRRLVDHTADFNLPYTEHAQRNLLAEGLHPRRILLTGSPMREVLDHYRAQIDSSDAPERLEVSPRKYFVVSAHRQENVDSPQRLALLVDSLNGVAERWESPILVSTHPRTRARIEADPALKWHNLVRLHEPFGFLDYNKLQLESTCVLSDSGTISEESTILGFPAVTLRSSIERPEALDTGAITMTDLQPRNVVAGTKFAIDRGRSPGLPTEYAVSNTSERVVNFILSTAPQHRFWSGLR